MKFRDSQNRVVERAVDDAGEVPVRLAITRAAQASRINGGALPVPTRPRRGPLLCDVTPLGEGVLQ